MSKVNISKILREIYNTINQFKLTKNMLQHNIYVLYLDLDIEQNIHYIDTSLSLLNDLKAKINEIKRIYNTDSIPLHLYQEIDTSIKLLKEQNKKIVKIIKENIKSMNKLDIENVF